MNFTPTVEGDLHSPREVYVTHYEYSTAVIVILSGLVLLAIVFTLCGLFMKAEAHVKTEHEREHGFLFQEVDTHFAGLGLSLDDAVGGWSA